MDLVQVCLRSQSWSGRQLGCICREKDGISNNPVDHKVAAVARICYHQQKSSVDNLTTLQKNFTRWELPAGKRLAVGFSYFYYQPCCELRFSCPTFDNCDPMDGKSAVQGQEQDSSLIWLNPCFPNPGAISTWHLHMLIIQLGPSNLMAHEPISENVTTNNWPLWSYEHCIHLVGEFNLLILKLLFFQTRRRNR